MRMKPRSREAKGGALEDLHGWEDAIVRIDGALVPLPAEEVDLDDALGRGLAEDVRLPRDLPPFANSAMDGWALSASSAPSAGAALRIAGERFAGSIPGEGLRPGEAVRIFTGAPLPPGADCVVRQEDARCEGEIVRLDVAAERGAFVRPAGEDGRCGEVALEAGTELRPAELGRLAALGLRRVPVHRRPTVGILSTGDELLAPGETWREGGIYESNGVALAAAAREAGGIPLRLGIARDRPGEAEALLRAAGGCDAIVTCGGASVGERDLVKGALVVLGAEKIFWRLAIKPGKPFGFFRLPGGTPVFLLPGNPASAGVTFEVFVRPALRRLAGMRGHGRLELSLPLAAAQRKARDLALFVRGNVEDGAFAPSPHQSSGLTRSLVGQRALAILPVGRDTFEAGERVPCRLV